MDNTNTQEGLYTALNTAYHIAGIKGYAKNQKEFANYLDISEPTLTRAFKKDPRYLTKNLIARIERKMRDSGMMDIKIIGDSNAVASAPHATASVVADHTAELIAELKEQRIMFSKQIEAQMDIIKNLTQALSRK